MSTVLTFLEGLLNGTIPLTSSRKLPSVPALAVVIGDSRPFSLFLPFSRSVSLYTGLEGSGASLLGAGVSFALGVPANDGLRIVEGVAVFLAELAAGGEDLVTGLEPASTFRWKNPRIDFWVLPDWEEAVLEILRVGGRGVATSFPSIPRAILSLRMN